MVTALAVPSAPLVGIPTSGLVYRFRAADLAQAQGSVVNSLPDSSTGGAGAAVVNSASRPTYQTAGIGGKPSILLAGGEWFTIPSHTRRTHMFVVQPTENPNFGDYRRIMCGSTLNTSGSIFAMVNERRFSPFAFDPNGASYGFASSGLRVNGDPNPSIISPLNVPLIISADLTAPLTESVLLFTFAGGNGGQAWIGHVSEVLIWNRLLSPGERMAAERTLGAYYRIGVRS